MYSLILQLLIILAFGSTIQSAPTKAPRDAIVTKEQNNQRELEKTLYCAAQSLYNAGGQLRERNYTPPPLSPLNISSSTEAYIDRMFRHHFSHRCKYFTKAMTLKHQLLDHLFKTNTALNLNSINIEKLSTILTSLQVMVNVFNDMEFNKHNRRCVKLTPAQYRIIYYAQYTNSLLASLKDSDLEKWYLDSRLYKYQTMQC